MIKQSKRLIENWIFIRFHAGFIRGIVANLRIGHSTKSIVLAADTCSLNVFRERCRTHRVYTSMFGRRATCIHSSTASHAPVCESVKRCAMRIRGPSWRHADTCPWRRRSVKYTTDGLPSTGIETKIISQYSSVVAAVGMMASRRQKLIAKMLWLETIVNDVCPIKSPQSLSNWR